MKLSSLFKMIKKEKEATLITQTGGRQWILVGFGNLYPLDGLPCLDEDKLLTMMDVPLDERENWAIDEKEMGFVVEQFARDSMEGDTEAEAGAVDIAFDGEDYRPVYTRRGLVLVPVDSFGPVSDSRKTYLLYAREVQGETAIIVKNGFQTIAAICRVKINDDRAAECLLDIARHVAGDANAKKLQELMENGEQQTM